MPAIVIDGDNSQGHCWLPTPSKAANNSSVKIGGVPVIILGDNYIPHIRSCTPNGGSTHAVATSQGSPSVLIGGISVVRDGDPLSCGDVADTVQLSVFANGGGNAAQIAPGEGIAAGETLGYFVRRIRDSYSNLTITGKYSSTGVIPNKTYHLEHWCPEATNLVHESEGFVITLEEEITGNEYPSFRGIGAPSIPAAASPVFREPFDAQVSYSSAPTPLGTVNEADGSFTFNTGYSPSLNSSSWNPSPGSVSPAYKSIPVLVTYSDVVSLIGEAGNYTQGPVIPLIKKLTHIPITFLLSLTNCP